MERVGVQRTVGLDAAAVERVLRRAHELSADRDRSVFAPPTMSEDVVVAAAAEVGIPTDMVLVSLAIERLGPAPPVHGGLDRLSGPGSVVVERALDLDSQSTLQRLDELLVGQHQLRRERTWPSALQWRKRTDAIGWAQRTIRNVSGQAALGKSAVITASASPVDERRCIVRLSLDRAAQRSGMITGGGAVATTGVAGLTALAIVASPLLLVASPVALAAGLGVSAHGRRQAIDSARELECLLDAVEQGVRPTAPFRVMRRMRHVRGSDSTRNRWL